MTELELLLDEVRNITDKIQTMKESLTDDTISVIEKAKGGLGRIVQMHMLVRLRMYNSIKHGSVSLKGLRIF